MEAEFLFAMASFSTSTVNASSGTVKRIRYVLAHAFISAHKSIYMDSSLELFAMALYMLTVMYLSFVQIINSCNRKYSCAPGN